MSLSYSSVHDVLPAEGHHYYEAKAASIAVAESRCNAAIAKEAFIAAAIEARVIA